MFSYYYNTFDRLVQVDDVNGTALGRYYYDPFGRRLWKQAGDETTLFFSSDEGLVAEYDPTGAELRSYGYRPDSTWTTDPLWLKQNGEYYFYHNDHLGTPQKLVKQNGAVVWSASYTAFGQATVEVNTITNNLRFPGQYYDAETGLHYNYFRYYAPGIGRYLRRDPIGFKGGINLFSYAKNNSLHIKDPLGLVGLCCKYPRETGGTTKEQCIQNCINRIYQGLLPWKASSALTAIGGLSLFFTKGLLAMAAGVATGVGLAILIPDIIYRFYLCPKHCNADPCIYPNKPVASNRLIYIKRCEIYRIVREIEQYYYEEKWTDCEESASGKCCQIMYRSFDGPGQPVEPVTPPIKFLDDVYKEPWIL